MRFHLTFLFFFISVLLVSCTSAQETVNNRINPVTLSAIRNGITTKEQVRAMLGSPQSTKTQIPVRQTPGVATLQAKYTASEIWGFWTTGKEKPLFHLPFTSPDINKQPSCTIIIFFDEHGTVLDCETSGQLPGKRDG